MKRKMYSPEEKRGLIKQVRLLTPEQSTEAACKSVGITYSNFYAWQRAKRIKEKSKPKKRSIVQTARALAPEVHTYHLNEKEGDEQVTILIGKASTVKANLETLLELRRLH